MEAKKKKIGNIKKTDTAPSKKHTMDFEDIDLGDADGSSNHSGMDNFESKAEKEKLPSEKGRIEEL